MLITGQDANLVKQKAESEEAESQVHPKNNPIVPNEGSDAIPVSEPLIPMPDQLTAITSPVETSDNAGSRSTSPKFGTKYEDDGLLAWISTRGFLGRVASKAKSSVDSMITTLDPGMKEYLCKSLPFPIIKCINCLFLVSGGDANILVASDKEDKITPIREAFIDVFGRATVKGQYLQIVSSKTYKPKTNPNCVLLGMSAQSYSIAVQPVGAAAALKAAEERIRYIRKDHTYDVPQMQVVISLENFLTELTPERYDQVPTFHSVQMY